MREEKASALPLLLDVRRMDENNRAYAYRMLRKNITVSYTHLTLPTKA